MNMLDEEKNKPNKQDEGDLGGEVNPKLRELWDWVLKEDSKPQDDEELPELDDTHLSDDNHDETNEDLTDTDVDAQNEIDDFDDEYYEDDEAEEDDYDRDDYYDDEDLGEGDSLDPLEESVKKKKKFAWGYTFVLVIMFTIFGSITIATYLVFLRSNITIPNIIVYVSIISLLFFLLLLVVRYLVLIYLSFLHHVRNKTLPDLPPDPNLKGSILVPAYNEEKVIRRSILSLLEINHPNYEIIVIDDGSKDDTLKIARSLEGWHRGVQVRVFTQPNKGKAEALNHGLLRATGHIIICMDGDSRLGKNALRMGMRHFKDPKIHAVAGNVKVINRINLLSKLQALEYIEGLNLARRAQAFFKAVNIVPGPMGFFRREVLLEVGGWEGDTFAEDCDLTLKVLNKGYGIEYEPDAISFTEAPENLIPLLKQRYRWTRGILQSIRKHSTGLINFHRGWRIVITMWQMIFEAIMWPFMSVLANIMFLTVAIVFGMSPLIVLWWIQLTILDTLAAMHTVAIEREKLSLVPYAILYRLFFIQIVDVTKLIATVEELLNIKMGWGKLERKGRI